MRELPIQFWINDKPVMTYDDAEYKTGHFAIQGPNPGRNDITQAGISRRSHSPGYRCGAWND
jgi:hypothetical protein